MCSNLSINTAETFLYSGQIEVEIGLTTKPIMNVHSRPSSAILKGLSSFFPYELQDARINLVLLSVIAFRIVSYACFYDESYLTTQSQW